MIWERRDASDRFLVNFEYELETCFGSGNIYINAKMYIVVVFRPPPLPDKFMLCERYMNLLQSSVLRLAAGVGQAKSISNKNLNKEHTLEEEGNMLWKRRNTSERIFFKFE